MIDIIRIIYKELFTVRFLHNGYGPARQKSISESMHIVPDQETSDMFSNYNLSCKFFDNSLVCFIRSGSGEPKAPYIKFLSDVRIRFLQFVTSDFLAKSVVVAAGARQVYQFSNKENIGINMFITKHEGVVDNDDLEDSNTVEPGESCFGVIDIYTTSNQSGYSLFDNITNQRISSPVFKIQFASKI
jgi:hypothetical protein